MVPVRASGLRSQWVGCPAGSSTSAGDSATDGLDTGPSSGGTQWEMIPVGVCLLLVLGSLA